MATSKEAIAKLNVLSSYETSKEKREEYKECIYTILKDLEILIILKKHIYFSSKSGCIRMKDIYKSIKNFDFETLKEWLEDERKNEEL